jgi:hypothetical protein
VKFIIKTKKTSVRLESSKSYSQFAGVRLRRINSAGLRRRTYAFPLESGMGRATSSSPVTDLSPQARDRIANEVFFRFIQAQSTISKPVQ